MLKIGDFRVKLPQQFIMQEKGTESQVKMYVSLKCNHSQRCIYVSKQAISDFNSDNKIMSSLSDIERGRNEYEDWPPVSRLRSRIPDSVLWSTEGSIARA